MEEEHAEDAGSAGQIGAIGGATPGVARKMCRREERNGLCWRGRPQPVLLSFVLLSSHRTPQSGQFGAGSRPSSIGVHLMMITPN